MQNRSSSEDEDSTLEFNTPVQECFDLEKEKAEQEKKKREEEEEAKKKEEAILKEKEKRK